MSCIGKNRQTLRRLTVLAFAVAGLWMPDVRNSLAEESPTKPAIDSLWTDRVEPILKKNCYSCHGAEKKKGDLDLRSLQAMLIGGIDGSVVIPGKPADSPLIQRVQSDEDDRMPPEKDQHLSAEEILVLSQWITTLSVTSKPGDLSFDKEHDVPTLVELATRVQWSPPTEMQPWEAIDHLVAATWQSKRVRGSGTCDDATFVRRIYLDLVGRVPTVLEAETFVQSTDKHKRTKLVDELLASREYPRRMAELLDVILLDRKGKAAESQRKSSGWFAYLERSIAANRPWNEVVKELIVARPTSAESKGSQWFLYEQKNNHQQMAEAIAPVAFGVAIDCAQCHDHPLAHEIKQQNYWGLVAAFNRTTNADTSDGPALSESATGGFVNFTNLRKESQPAVLSLLNGKVIEEVRPADDSKEEDSNDKYHVPPSGDKKRPRTAAIPKFSRRQAVADAIVVDNPLLARAFVNRMWATLLGRGLVQPVNEMDSRHAPSHPELLSWLAQDFETSGYDIKRLIRNIVLSRTYQLQVHTGDQPPLAPELFASGLEKPLTAEVLYRAMLTATGNAQEGTDELRQELIATFPAVFAMEYNATLQQSALLTNSPLIDALLKPQGENLTARLLAQHSAEEKVRGAFAAILGRSPDADELAQSVDYLQNRADRPEAAVRHLEWALLVSPEFLLNH